MKFAWIFAFLPLCLGLHNVTEENCMSLVPTFTSIMNGSSLNVCLRYLQDEQQCCSQSDEEALGMTLSNAISYNVTLGSELEALQTNAANLYTTLSGLRMSLLYEVLQPLMNNSVDRTNTAQSFDTLDMIREEVLNNTNDALQGNMGAILTQEIMRYFTEGISGYYVDLTIETGPGSTITLDDEQRACAINAIYDYVFTSEEQTMITSLGNNLQQIAVAYEVARDVLSSTATILTELQNFNPTYTCTNVWTQQYACPLCAGQATPLCEGRCNEVLIGCMSSLQQVIVQLNVLLDFARASVSSLISGDPYGYINVNNIGRMYTDVFNSSLGHDRGVLFDDITNAGCNINVGRRKRDIDSPIVRHKRQRSVMFPTVTIDQSIVTMIRDTLLPAVMNVSLANDRTSLCGFLNAVGSGNCTIGVGNVSTYTSTFNSLEIADQNGNLDGAFNQTQLREQARPLTYAVTELLTNRSDIMMLYKRVLPGRDIPNLDFLNEPTPSPTVTVTVTSTATSTPRPSQPGDGGATAVSFSLFIMLVALLCATVFVN